MASVLKTARAETDLDDIWLFVAADNMRAADALIDSIAESASRLAEHPLMGRARPELAAALRSFPEGRYVLFYRPVPTGIELVRVLQIHRFAKR